jgi:hypothetical protein
MKRHPFPLRSVGVIRAHQLWVARRGLAEAVRVSAAVSSRVTAKADGIAQLNAAQAAARAGGLRAAEEVAFGGHHRRESAELVQLEHLRARAEAEVAAKRAACLAAERAVEMIERLEAAALASHRAADLRSIQLELDECAGRRLRRRPSAHG